MVPQGYCGSFYYCWRLLHHKDLYQYRLVKNDFNQNLFSYPAFNPTTPQGGISERAAFDPPWGAGGKKTE
jgi:hypothetical protein